MFFSAGSAAAFDVSDYESLKSALQSTSTQINPINVMEDIEFDNIIIITNDSYITDNNYIFDGGRSYNQDGTVKNSGVEGFRISGGEQFFYDLDMTNFHSDTNGGAIFKNGGVMNVYNSTFTNNVAFDTANIGLTYGGAIDNKTGLANIYNSYFANNSAKIGGGAIINDGTLHIHNSAFVENKANSTSILIGSQGGAISNYGTVYIHDTLFEKNLATADNLDGLGGAIYNQLDESVYIYNSSFFDNVAQDLGGAIYNDQDLYIYAIDDKTVFSGNMAGGVSNAIYNTCLVNLLANENGSIVFDDKITSIINAPMNIGDTDYSGKVILNADMSGVLGINTLRNGSLVIGNNMGVDNNGDLNMFGGGMIVDTVLGGKSFLDMANGDYNKYNASNKLDLRTDLYANIDVDLETKKADKFVGLETSLGSGNVIIDAIDLKKDFMANNLAVEVAQISGDRIKLSDDAKTIVTPIHTYSVSDANLASKGELIFNVEGYHSSVLASSNAKKAHGLVLTDITKHVLTPNNTPTTFNNLASGDEPKLATFWFDAKGLSEEVELGDSHIDNDTYLAIGGFDIKGELFYDWNIRYSIYGGYVGSRQEYDDVKINQDGFAVGLGARFEKNNIFSAFTTNFITSFVDGNHAFGSENFNIYSGSLGNKTGYYYHFADNKYTLKPNLTFAYHYVHTQDYTNAANVEISSDDLQIFHIAPELKFVANLDNGFSPYVAASYNWNIESGGDVNADNILLPSLAVENYAEYAIGFGKNFASDIHSYAEVILTSGDRSGGGVHIGMKWQF